MKELTKDWLTQSPIDFEYKKYLLLAYFQFIEKRFRENKLYPFQSDLIFHYKNIRQFKENKSILNNHFPKAISKANFEKFELVYNKIIEDGEVVSELEKISDFALPFFERYLKNGNDIFDFFEDNIEIIPVGVHPVRDDEGFLFIKQVDQLELQIFEYQVTLFENEVDKYRGIRFQFIENIKFSVFESLEKVKQKIINKYNRLYTPGAYFLESRIHCPLEETLIPIAKRMLIKRIRVVG